MAKVISLQKILSNHNIILITMIVDSLKLPSLLFRSNLPLDTYATMIFLLYVTEPVPKPRLNVTLSNESGSDSCKKKRPVPQPRSLASKSASRMFSTSDIQPVASAHLKIYSKVPSRRPAGRLSEPPMPSSPPKTSSSSSSEDEYIELPPALPPKGCTTNHNKTH